MTSGPGGGRPRQLVLQPDALDRQIITLLRADGRRSNREIARRLGVPEATVRYRVRRLTDGGVLKITASVDPELLGYALTAVISVQVEPRTLVSASDSIAAMPEVMWLAISAGASDIILTASFYNQEDLFQFITERIAHVAGVLRTETAVCMKMVKKPHQWATDLTTTLSAAPTGAFAREDDEPYDFGDVLLASDG
jgi:Lrp/AsnC family transcriptional regulator for asnA, asnC and gidA